MDIYDCDLQKSLSSLRDMTVNQEDLDIEEYLPVKQQKSSEMYSRSIDPMDVATHLIGIMPLEVFKNESDYADIVCAMKHVFSKDNEHKRGLQILVEHLKDDESLVKKVKKDWYSVMYSADKYTHVAIGEILLRRYPAIYLLWHSYWLSGTYESIINTMSRTSNVIKISPNDLSDLIYKMFWLDYLYFEDKWYTFDQNCILINDNTSVTKMVISLLNDNRQWRYKNITHTTYDARENSEKIGDTSYLQSFLKFYTHISNNLKPTSIETFLRAKFSFGIKKEMNDDPERILWKNGYMTVAKTTCISVVGPHIEDLYTMKTSTDFPDEKPPDKDIYELYNWLFQAYPEGTHEFMLTDWASFLHGVNVHRKNRSWVGVGANSKSKLLKLIENLLGDYCVVANQGIVMEQENQNNATTSMNIIMKARVACINEPSIDLHLSAEQLKIISGGDRISTRKLFQEGATAQNMSKIIIVCNNIPSIKNADKPTRERFEVHPHVGKWCSDPDDPEMVKKYKYRYKIDSSFDNKIPKLARALAWVLVNDYYPRYVEWVNDHSRRKLPELFACEQDKQWRRVCKLSKFVHEKVIPFHNDKCYVTLVNIQERYIASMCSKSRSNTENDFVSECIRDMCLSGKFVDEKLYGYCIKYQNNSVFYNNEEGKAIMSNIDEIESKD